MPLLFGRRALLAMADPGARGGEPGGRSLWQDARARFLRNRAAVASLAVLALVTLFALFGGFLAAWSNEEIDWSMLGSVAEKGAPSLANGHWFGVDELGRDLFARTVQGTRVSLAVGIVGALISVVVGTLYGATAGYFGGRLDSVMMRVVDVLMAIPYMFVLILFMVVFGRSMLMLFVGIGLISWLDMARIARGQTLSIKNRSSWRPRWRSASPPAASSCATSFLTCWAWSSCTRRCWSPR